MRKIHDIQNIFGRKRIELPTVPMDNVLSDISSVGIPGLIFILAVKLAGYSGAPAITTALKNIGFKQSMPAGVLNLIVLSRISENGINWIIERLAIGVMQQRYKQGDTKDSIIEIIEELPVSSSLKAKLCEEIEKFDDSEPLETATEISTSVKTLCDPCN